MKKEMKNSRTQMPGSSKSMFVLLLILMLTGFTDSVAANSGLLNNTLNKITFNTADYPVLRFSLERKKPEFSLNPPSSFSLEHYMPPIGNQSDVGSCVGWASAYYGLSIVKRIEGGSTAPAFSPWSLFNRYSYMHGKRPCSSGAEIDDCLQILKSKGCATEKEYKIPYCAIDKNKSKYKNKLYGFQRLQHKSALQIKSSIASQNPVVIGIKIFSGGMGNSMNSKFLDSNGIIKMEFFRDKSYADGLHAMCIVGYDDNIGGGAFKIANSWGKEWGKDGFCWLRYSDLNVLVSAYSLQARPEEKSKKPARAAK